MRLRSVMGCIRRVFVPRNSVGLAIFVFSFTALFQSWTPSAPAQSKDELKAELAAARAALAAAKRDQQTLDTKIDKTNREAVASRAKAANLALVNTEAAKTTAGQNAIEANKKADDAKTVMEQLKTDLRTSTAQDAQRQNDAEKRYLMLITGGFAFLGLMVPILHTLAKDRGAHQSVQDQIELERSRREVNAKLDQIHSLVNSDLTKSMRSELGALDASYASQAQSAEAQLKAGLLQSPESIASIEATRVKAAALRAEIGERDVVAARAEAALAASAAAYEREQSAPKNVVSRFAKMLRGA